MNSYAALRIEPCRPEPHVIARWSGEAPAEAIQILDDVRAAIKRNLPENARVAALRLVTCLTPPAEPERPVARGGLAPWQKRKVDLYLREHLEESVRLDELAELLPLSVSHFCRSFKETFGDTPHAYIIRLRLELAQKLMLTTDDSLSQIALASGFSDQAHLCKLFRRGVAETPSAWRRRNLTDRPAHADAIGRMQHIVESLGSSGQAPLQAAR